MPLSLCNYLQDQDLDFDGAVWTAKQSNSGFSVSFFWKTASTSVAGVPPRKKRKRHRKKKLTNPQMPSLPDSTRKPSPTVQDSTSSVSAHQEESAFSSFESEPELESGPQLESMEEDLTANMNVSFEIRDHAPGLSSVNDEGEKWIPVKRRRMKKHQVRPHAVDATGSDSELDVETARQVYYKERGAVPGLYVRRGCTRDSVPAANPSTIASRTRARAKCTPT